MAKKVYNIICVESTEEIPRGDVYEKPTLWPQRKEANVWAFLSDDERVKMGHVLRRSVECERPTSLKVAEGNVAC